MDIWVSLIDNEVFNSKFQIIFVIRYQLKKPYPSYNLKACMRKLFL
jgi:hypothetical protein